MPVVDVWHTTRPKEGAVRCKEHKLYPSAKHGQGKRWAARYRDNDGVQHGPLCDRKEDARAAYEKAVGDLARDEYIDPRASRIKVRDKAKQWLDGQTTDPNTIAANEHRIRLHITPTLGDKHLREIKVSTVRAWSAGLERKLAPVTVRAIYSLLSTILQSAVDDGELAKNPCKVKGTAPAKPAKRLIVPWSDEWVDGAYDALPARFREMVTVGASIGLRQGEIFGLAVEDVDFLRGWVHVRRQVKLIGTTQVFALPKRQKERGVPLPSSVGLRLAAHLQEFAAEPVTLPWTTTDGKPRTARLIFTTEDGGALHRTRFNEKVWHAARKQAGIPESRENGMHALRHRFASVLLDGGVSIREVAEWLGHDDPGFTLRTYTHLMKRGEDRMRAAVDEVLNRPSALVVRAVGG